MLVALVAAPVIVAAVLERLRSKLPKLTKLPFNWSAPVVPVTMTFPLKAMLAPLKVNVVALVKPEPVNVAVDS